MFSQEKKLSILKKYWGYEEFRPHQLAIIDSVLTNQDTIALMATGGGKSLCYQLPGMLLEGVCIVISPLIALMEDQQRALTEKGIKAEVIHSGKSKKRQDELFDNAVYGNLKFLFLSPEKLQTELALVRISKMNVSFFAIDEAHCISQWGHDFRPSYLKLDILKENFPKKTILALTATATENVLSDISEVLAIKQDVKVFRSSFSRPNISISVVKSANKLESITHFVKRVKGSKIIYARNKRHCHEINHRLNLNGIKSQVYHADVSIPERKKRQDDWINDRLECMVCTSAFGMGIDKSNVRLVLHFDLPPSLEEYIQEIGRAGRDGAASFAVMLYNNYDLEELEFHYEQGRVSISRIKEIYHKLGTFLEIPMESGFGQSYNLNAEKFLEKAASNKIELKSALQTLEKNEYLRLSSSFFSSDKFRIIASRNALSQYLGESSDIAKLMQYLLRNYEGLLYGFVNVSLAPLLKLNNWSMEHLGKVIATAQKQNLLEYIHDDGSEKVTFLTARLPYKNLSFDRKALRSFYKAKRNRYEYLVNYVLNEDCRSNQLLAYFDEVAEKRCGNCDFCRGAFEKEFTTEEFEAAKITLKTYLHAKRMNAEEVLEMWPYNRRNKLKSILNKLADQGFINYSNNRFTLSKKA